MSYDLKINTICNHRIYRELVTLEDERRTIRFSKPLSASNTELFASDDLVPRSDYNIIYDPDSLTVHQTRMILLNNKWKSIEDYFEVTYVTLKNFCPKCAGLEVLDDIDYDIRGALRVLRNEELLLQNLEKFTITEKESNPFHTYIGTFLVRLLGQKIIDSSYVSNKIAEEISGTLDVLKSLQDQYRFTDRPVTNGELLNEVENVKIRFDKDDPTIVRADITATAKSGRTVDYSQFLRLSP
jgi:hypothetical protein